MQENSHKLGCQHLSEENWVMEANKENMFVHEPAGRLLRHIASPKLLSVNKFNFCEYRLIFWLSVEWNILAGDEQDL